MARGDVVLRGSARLALIIARLVAGTSPLGAAIFVANMMSKEHVMLTSRSVQTDRALTYDRIGQHDISLINTALQITQEMFAVGNMIGEMRHGLHVTRLGNATGIAVEL